MKVAFRVDASLLMGSGHVMRCLTFANALTSAGAECHFLCRAHPGHLLSQIESNGHSVHILHGEQNDQENASPLAHSAWLGSSQTQDAIISKEILLTLLPDWLIVDHYALDSVWEELVISCCKKLMVIDDLADRNHICDVLLDQNIGREETDYSKKVSDKCKLLIGPKYALLRPEFQYMREVSLNRRSGSQVNNLLITMGGVDKDNMTGRILEALKLCKLLPNCSINVVMGANAPWLSEVRRISESMPWPTEVHTNIADMAEKMCKSDLAIGAVGSTSWERCCLGLPTLMVILAENQVAVARHLNSIGAGYLIENGEQLSLDLVDVFSRIDEDPNFLRTMSENSAKIVNGEGCNILVDIFSSIKL